MAATFAVQEDTPYYPLITGGVIPYRQINAMSKPAQGRLYDQITSSKKNHPQPNVFRQPEKPLTGNGIQQITDLRQGPTWTKVVAPAATDTLLTTILVPIASSGR